MRIAIVDDEKSEREMLKEYVCRYFAETGESYECVLFAESIGFVSDYAVPFDIIFLDIEMPDMDGMTAARKIREVDSHTVLIFVTRMAQYAIKGYEVEAMDFMVKPVSYYKFAIRMKRAIAIATRYDSFSVVSEGRTIILTEDDVYYIEGSNQYIIYHTQKENYRVHGSLKILEKQLSACFARCHNSYIVNLRYVGKIEGNEVTVRDERLPISRERKKEFMTAINRFIGGF